MEYDGEGRYRYDAGAKFSFCAYLQFSPVISESAAPFVHHTLTYLCSNLDNSSVGDSELCDGTHIDIQLCRFTGVIFAAWAVGGTVCMANTCFMQ